MSTPESTAVGTTWRKPKSPFPAPRLHGGVIVEPLHGVDTRIRHTLTGKAMRQQDAYRMIQRRTRDTGIKTRIGNHTFRATGITAYLKNKGTLEAAQHIAHHESPRTTKLYDRREEEISLDEVERIAI